MNVVPDTIHAAAKRGDLEALRRFVEVDGIDVNCRDKDEYSALHLAVNSHDLNPALVHPILRYLISKNANVEAKGDSGLTPLMLASFYGYSEAVGILLEEGSANVDYCPEGRVTALVCACRSSLHRHCVVSRLLQNGANVRICVQHDSILHMVTRNVETLCVILVHCRETLTELDYSNLLLHANRFGYIPLHYTKSAEIAKLLIEQPRRQHDNELMAVCQAQLVSKNSSGRTPRDFAIHQDTSNAQLLSYLERYETSALSIPGDSSGATKRHNLNMCIAVKLNPALNDFQQSVAQEAFDLIIDTTDCLDETAHAVLGYLSLLDVMKRTDKAI